MNELNITEYTQKSLEPSQCTHSVKYDEVPVQSRSFGERSGYIRIVSTSDCRFLVGKDPVVGKDGSILPAGVPEYFNVSVGSELKLSVVST